MKASSWSEKNSNRKNRMPTFDDRRKRTNERTNEQNSDNNKQERQNYDANEPEGICAT